MGAPLFAALAGLTEYPFERGGDLGEEGAAAA